MWTYSAPELTSRSFGHFAFCVAEQCIGIPLGLSPSIYCIVDGAARRFVPQEAIGSRYALVCKHQGNWLIIVVREPTRRHVEITIRIQQQPNARTLRPVRNGALQTLLRSRPIEGYSKVFRRCSHSLEMLL